MDQTINGNGKGFPRVVEAPAVKPSSDNPTNNINVIALSYVPKGMNIHFQTPFGLGTAPVVTWGTDRSQLENTSSGQSHSYDRTPPCSLVSVTMCSQYFHEVQLKNLRPDTTYYYQIQAANGTTASDVLSFTTARDAGVSGKFTLAVLNDMGYINADGTHKQLVDAATSDEPLAFAWHGGDLSYADDWSSGFMPCEDSWPVCYNGSSTELPGPAPVPDSYKDVPLPAGEVANQGGPEGGDISVIYETNWDLWQQWINNITMVIPYMVMPGNHEAACAEFDGPGNDLSAYLVNNETNATVPETELTYYSCPVSQRNYTAYQHRFRMPGDETKGASNFWYSFDYGLAHFITLDGETDFPYSPEWPFVRDDPSGLPEENKTFVTDSGPFGAINGDWRDNEAYEQWNWLQADLAAVDRTKTPWIFVMSHRPMYSSQTASYQRNVRDAFQPLLLKYGVDAYFSGHIHWYERLFPLTADGEIDTESIKDDNTYYVNEGNSLTHIINGMAGNIESHSTLYDGHKRLNITNVLDYVHFGFSKLTVHNESAAYWEFIKGDDGTVGDYVWLLKPNNSSSSNISSSTTALSKSSLPTSSSANLSSIYPSSGPSNVNPMTSYGSNSSNIESSVVATTLSTVPSGSGSGSGSVPGSFAPVTTTVLSSKFSNATSPSSVPMSGQSSVNSTAGVSAPLPASEEPSLTTIAGGSASASLSAVASVTSNATGAASVPTLEGSSQASKVTGSAETSLPFASSGSTRNVISSGVLVVALLGFCLAA